MIKFPATLALISVTGLAQADPITLPNTLSNNTLANADNVQENFDALVTQSNENDAQITAIVENLVIAGNNTAIGGQALRNNTTGSGNSASGYQALFSNTEGSSNTASGSQALRNNTEGGSNTAVGRYALEKNTTGSFNVAIGAGADVTLDNLSYAVAIGPGARVDASDKVRIGDNFMSVIEGAVPFTSTSDARLKESIHKLDRGLALVNDLNPVSYHRINNSSDDIEMGLLAQEVAETLAKHGLEKSGMVHQATPDAYMSVRYNDLLAPMIRAIQELDDAGDKKDAQIASLQQKLSKQESVIARQQQEMWALLQAQQKQIARLEGILAAEQVAAR